MEENRKLSKDELARKEKFEILVEEYKKKGYEMREKTISIETANIAAIVIAIPITILLGVVYWLVNKKINITSGWNILIILLGFYALVVVHELIHGIFFAIFAKKGFKSVFFGIMWEYLTPYCSCGEPISKLGYIISLLMPTVVLGFGLSIVGIITNSFVWFGIGALHIFGGGGDLMILFKILSDKEKCELILDHPYKIGYACFECEK